MNWLNPRHPIYRRILSSRIVRYPIYIYIFLIVLGAILPDEDECDPDSLECAQSIFAGTNPWRDLPPEQETALKEVHFIMETLRDTFHPTTIPEEDDYEFLSKLVRSLETREDISWTTMNEIRIDSTVSAIAQRRDGDFAPEPFELTERLRKLNAHWWKLQLDPNKPDAWDPRHDTTFVPPLLRTRGLDGEGAVESAVNVTATLSEEQRKVMEERYAYWRDERDRKVAYLKIHPPEPMAWAPKAKSTEGIKTAWDDVLEGRELEGGMSVGPESVAASPRWKPMYRSLLTENVPYGWRRPGEAEMTAEESKKFMEKLNRQWKLRDERKEKQKAVQEKLKAEKEGRKDEL